MKKDKENNVQQSKSTLENKDRKTGKANSIKKNIPEWPEEYEEDRSMDIRMKKQPFSQSIKENNRSK
jgi:hypothetical protein